MDPTPRMRLASSLQVRRVLESFKLASGDLYLHEFVQSDVHPEADELNHRCHIVQMGEFDMLTGSSVNSSSDDGQRRFLLR